MTTETQLTEIERVREQVDAIARTLDEMPFGGMVHAPRANPDASLSSRLAAQAEWLRLLVPVLQSHSARVTADRAELDRLQRQRAAIRAFLGTGYDE